MLDRDREGEEIARKTAAGKFNITECTYVWRNVGIAYKFAWMCQTRQSLSDCVIFNHQKEGMENRAAMVRPHASSDLQVFLVRRAKMFSPTGRTISTTCSLARPNEMAVQVKQMVLLIVSTPPRN